MRLLSTIALCLFAALPAKASPITSVSLTGSQSVTVVGTFDPSFGNAALVFATTDVYILGLENFVCQYPSCMFGVDIWTRAFST